MTLKLFAALAAMAALAGCVDDEPSGNTEGTFRGQTGEDPALANMSMCSDGALREDCSFAPNGY